MIDHTLLAPETTPGQVAMFCAEAVSLGVGAVCVAAGRLPLPQDALPAGVGVVAVVGFPSGAHHSDVKAFEARSAVDDGATELDVVIDLGAAAAGLWHAVETDLKVVREAAPTVVFKAIIESAMLHDRVAIATACSVAEAAGADFVKTSTGFHPSGGATVEAVSIMAEAVSGRIGVKAAGGIRDLTTALRLVDAGATRLGCSSSRSILDALQSTADDDG